LQFTIDFLTMKETTMTLPTLQMHLAPLSTIEVALAATFVDLGIWDLIDVDAWMCSKVAW
jgi:hypothetical protein